MSSIDNEELFEKYYQNKYDYDTLSLTDEEVFDIKRFVGEQRYDYATAPIGENIFNFISEKNPNICFESISFRDNIDGLLYISKTGNDKAYIVINSNIPLVNQIFTAAHEYYHYKKDYDNVKNKPYLCSFLSLKDVNEKKASRFAAELLLPEAALKKEYDRFCISIKDLTIKDDFMKNAIFSILLTKKYQMPLKSVIYRLYEEGIIKNIEKYLKNYTFIKEAVNEIRVNDKEFERIYSKENRFINDNSLIYKQMKKSYENGQASREEIINDAKALDLDLEIINSFFDDLSDDDSSNDILDDELFELLKAKVGA